MKAAVFEKPGKVTVQSVDDPQLAADEVLLKVAACGICGSDMHVFEGMWPAPFPLIRGHEFSGTIETLGTEVEDLEVGQRVAVNPCLYCGHCRFCQEGRLHFCENLEAYGASLPGGFAEYVSVRRESVLPCARLPLEEAALIEPVACGMHGIGQLGSCLGNKVLIFGCGTQGLILLQLSKLNGASMVTAVDLFDKKLEFARKLGADEVLKSDEHLDSALKDLGPYDVVVDAVGNTGVVESMFQHADKGARLLAFGVCPPKGIAQISPFEIFERELKIYGSFTALGDFPGAIRLLESGAIDVRSLITHRFPLDEIAGALEKMEHPVDSAKI